MDAEDVSPLQVNASFGLQGGSRFGYSVAMMSVFRTVIVTAGAASGWLGVIVIMTAGTALMFVRRRM